MKLLTVILSAVIVAACATTPPPPEPTTTTTRITLPVMEPAPILEAVPPTTVAPTTTVAPPPPMPEPTLPPPPVVAPEPAVPVVVEPATDLESLICATFTADCGKALSVVYCESRFNPGTVGAAGERGLFQIHPVHIPYLAERGMTWDSMFDPASNIAYAYDLYNRSGWGPWTCA